MTSLCELQLLLLEAKGVPLQLHIYHQPSMTARVGSTICMNLSPVQGQKRTRFSFQHWRKVHEKEKNDMIHRAK